MHIKLRRFAEQLLFAFNILIAFLFLFEDKLVIPVWLQTIGRMHPLILHFPIVILLMAMLMEFFRFRYENSTNPFYQHFLENLLLTGALFAAVTVLMGLFLSREEGYAGNLLLWHKWTGLGIFYLTSLIYLVRNSRWYKAPLARSGALLIVAGLILTGHYGASLTHGDNFIFDPIFNQQELAAVPLEKAVVFTDLIQPVLEQKCVSCHNPDKLKGELALTNPGSIKKGGKSGRLFVPGDPDASLLLQRVHLPAEDKKHMPPTGKTQLSSDEIQLLSLWVKENAGFTKRVVDLPGNDPLRLLSAGRLRSAVKSDDIFDFDAADEAKIKNLNNDYRTVAPLAKGSPALSVNIYNRSAFNSKQLDELEAVREQVVLLNLNKMPVKNEDLKSIAKFVNLRKLDLNFTDITGAGLKELKGLKHLQSLTISGTKVGFKELNDQIASFQNLRAVSVWDTEISAADLMQLQKSNSRISFIGGFRDDGKKTLKLNPPQIRNIANVFSQPTPLLLKHPIKGVFIRFTTDGSEPDSLKSPVFDKTLLNESVTIKARAFKNGWFGSDLATFDFFKCTYKPDSVILLLPLNRVHQAEGAKTFFDNKLGVIGANNPAWANNWAAVRDNDMAVVSEFKKPVTISSVGMHYMIEEDTGIFPPDVVEIWGGPTLKHLKLLAKIKPGMPSKGDKPALKSFESKFDPELISYLKIVARPVTKIPDWNKNKGKKALLLVDEMFIN